MLLPIFLFIFNGDSVCPRYSFMNNPTTFIKSVNLLTSFYDSEIYKYAWPSTLNVSCSPELETPTEAHWYNSFPTDYYNNNMTAVIDLSGNLQIRQNPTCIMTTGVVCLMGTTFPIYISRINYIFENGDSIDACAGQAFAIKLLDFTKESAPFVTFQRRLVCTYAGIYLLYDTLYVDSIDSSLPSIDCQFMGNHIFYNLNMVTSSPNCMGPKDRILFPTQNAEIYYYEHEYYFGNMVVHTFSVESWCHPAMNHVILKDANGNEVISVSKAPGKHKYSCEIKGDKSSVVNFYVIIPKLPEITKPLKDCMRCDNKCVFSFDYDEGLYVGPIDVRWYFNGEELQNDIFNNISSDKRTLSITIKPDVGGNVQVIISNRYGTQMTSAYVLYTKAPVFSLDLPKYRSLNSSNNVFTAKVNFIGSDDVKMWFIMNGKPLNSSNKNAKATFDLVTHTYSLEINNSHKDDPIVESFSCGFQAGSCHVESTTCTVSKTDKIRSTVSLMIPVLGVLGAAVLLAIILIPVCIVYRNRHSKAYRLAMVERQCGLNPDKDFKTLNDFGENSRRQARNHLSFSILPSGVGSNEGSWAPVNNMPEIKEQASFVNDYQA